MPRPRNSRTYRLRRLHRYLGVFIGVQFLLWTLGGLYFSWTDLDTVHGDHLRRPARLPRADGELASPSAVVSAVRREQPVDSIASLALVDVLGRPTYRLTYFGGTADGTARRVQLADARTGELRGPVDREEAIRLAREAFIGPDTIRSVEYLTPASVGRHHEYREQPLPAWAVTFAHDEAPTAYVAAELGEVVRIRNTRWRVFDLFWMLHTMDYRGRDDFNNLVLRAFAVFGLLTVGSGFALFATTSGWARARRRRAAATMAAAGD